VGYARETDEEGEVQKYTQTRLTHRPRSGPELLMLNQFVMRRDVTDRARSKPDKTYEGTRYCRAIRSIACAAAGMKHFGWGKLFLWLLSLQQQRK
jgi:hypothetical protein